MVDLPTPPLPVTNRSFRSSREVTAAASAAEADAAAVVGTADLEVGNLLGRDAHLTALAVGEPERAAIGDGGVDLLALGTIAHGQGTAQAVTEGELQGAMAGVAMGVAAVLTSMTLPMLLRLIV